MTRTPRVAAAAGALALLLAIACSGGAPDASHIARGRGLTPTTLTPVDEAGVYEAAVRASFDVEPALVLLAHPRRLPRTTGHDGGDDVPPALLRALRDRGVVRGSCEPKHEAARDTPRCPGAQAGYVVRASPVFLVGRDTLQIHFAAEAFGAETGPRPQALRFEKIYQLLADGAAWRVVREARVKEQR